MQRKNLSGHKYERFYILDREEGMLVLTATCIRGEKVLSIHCFLDETTMPTTLDSLKINVWDMGILQEYDLMVALSQLPEETTVDQLCQLFHSVGFSRRIL